VQPPVALCVLVVGWGVPMLAAPMCLPQGAYPRIRTQPNLISNDHEFVLPITILPAPWKGEGQKRGRSAECRLSVMFCQKHTLTFLSKVDRNIF